jgi:hypothetical protein
VSTLATPEPISHVAKQALGQTHAGWIIADRPATSFDHLTLFETPPDNTLHPPQAPECLKLPDTLTESESCTHELQQHHEALRKYAQTLFNIVGSQ